MALLAALAATASACSTRAERTVTQTRIVRPALPPVARAPCDRPQALPDADLSAEAATRLWGRDRAALRICESRRAAAVAAIDN